MSFWGELKRRDKVRIAAASAFMARFLAAGLLYVTLLPHAAIAQETDVGEVRPIEEVVVGPPRTPEDIQSEIREAENYAFSVYNDLNADDDYDIVCRRESPMGTRRMQRSCRARFVDRLIAEATQEFFLAETVYTDPTAEIRRHTAILEAKINALAGEHPQLYEAARALHLRKAELAAALDLDELEPVNCVSRRRVRSMNVVDDGTVLFFMQDGRIYQNILDRHCSGLKNYGVLNFTQGGGRFCANYGITVRQTRPTAGTPGARIACRIGPFYPLSKNRAEEMLIAAAGVLDDTTILIEPVDLPDDDRGDENTRSAD